MDRAILDADEILQHASPVVHQAAHEVQPYGHLIRMPIALAESACKESVENLNQLLADSMTLRDLYKKHHWHVSGRPSTNFISCLTTLRRKRSDRFDRGTH